MQGETVSKEKSLAEQMTEMYNDVTLQFSDNAKLINQNLISMLEDLTDLDKKANYYIKEEVKKDISEEYSRLKDNLYELCPAILR